MRRLVASIAASRQQQDRNRAKLRVDQKMGQDWQDRHHKTQDRHEFAQLYPKMGHKGGKMDTKKGQEGAREAQLGPKMVQVGPRWSRKGARWSPRGARKMQERPKLAPRAARKKGTPNFMIF